MVSWGLLRAFAEHGLGIWSAKHEGNFPERIDGSISFAGVWELGKRIHDTMVWEIIENKL